MEIINVINVTFLIDKLDSSCNCTTKYVFLLNYLPNKIGFIDANFQSLEETTITPVFINLLLMFSFVLLLNKSYILNIVY